MNVNTAQRQTLFRALAEGRRLASGKSDVGRIARKEFIETSRDGRFRWAAGFIFVLLLLSLLAGGLRYAGVNALHSEAQQAERERWLNQGAKSPHSAAHYGIYVFKPQTPLSVIDSGVEPYVGVAGRLEAHKQNIFQYKPAEDSAAVRRFGELTAATTLQLLIPVLIILLGYSTFAGERELGTLRQLLSLGVRSRDLALGKALGASAPLILVLAPASFFGAVALAASSLSSLSDNYLRLLLMALGYLAYFGVFIGLTLTVSALAATARQALIVLLAFWFVGCLMTPPVVTDLARLLYPNPTALEFAAMIREDRLKVKTWYRRLADVEARLLGQYNVDSADKLPVSPKGIALMEEEADADRIQEARFDALHETHTKQSRVYQAAAFLSPMLAVQSLSMGLSGSDYAHHRHFAQAAEQYRRRLIYIMNEDDMANSKPDAAPYIPTMRGRDLWEKAPPFQYTAPAVGWAIQNQAPNIVILCAWFVIISGVTVGAVSRLKVN
jgi:ABC-2 type transport system permease protein